METYTKIPFSIDGPTGERLTAIQGSVGESGKVVTTLKVLFPFPSLSCTYIWICLFGRTLICVGNNEPQSHIYTPTQYETWYQNICTQTIFWAATGTVMRRAGIPENEVLTEIYFKHVRFSSQSALLCGYLKDWWCQDAKFRMVVLGLFRGIWIMLRWYSCADGCWTCTRRHYLDRDMIWLSQKCYPVFSRSLSWQP